MTGRFRSYLRRLTHALYDDYLGIVGRSVLHRLFTPREDPLWAALSHTFEYMLKWADLITGQSLHKQADPRTPELPVPDRLLDPGTSDFDWRGEWAKVYGETVERTSWAPEHVRETQPFIVERARLVAKAEAEFLEEKRRTQRLDPNWMPIYRIEMHRQMALKEIQQVSEQVELAVPEIGQMFPYVLYNTREDRRVRPTHAAMQGFIAARTWGGWPAVRPPNGYRCRCTLRYVARHEARRLNWLDAAGDPLFEVRWPSSLAKVNYESGLFPDPNTPFVGPKVWAYGDDLAGVGD